MNAGPSRAAKRLQRGGMATQDGKIGPKTLSMVFNMEPAALLDKYAQACESYYRSLKTFEIYGRGWLRRNDAVLEKAKLMVLYIYFLRFAYENGGRISSFISNELANLFASMTIV